MEVKRNSGLFIGDVDIAPASGTIEITENGEHNVAEYATADVDVAQDFTVNESYDISEGTLTKGNITLEGDVVANIPDGVTTLGGGAFSENHIINSVIMPNSITTIEDGAPWLNVHGSFIKCSALKTIVFSKSLTTIGDYTFSNCTSLTSITIPDSVTSIGNYTFSNCISLTSITIPDSVTSIGDRVFYNCTSLTSITIPDSVTTIGEYAFSACASLTSITIPDSVTTIGNDVFDGCNGLTDIYYTGTQAEWEAITGIADAGIPTGATIHYEYAGNGSEL